AAGWGAPTDRRRGGGNGPVRQVRRGRRRGPDRDLQLGPLPDGRPRVARRHAAVRGRERDRRRPRAGVPAGRRPHPGPRRGLRDGPVPPDAGLPGGAGPPRLRRGPELPDRPAQRRHGPPGAQGAPVGLIGGLSRRGLEDTGRGFALEVERIAGPARLDLLTTAYAFTAEEGRA